MSEKIHLSQKSTQELIDLCALVLSNNPNQQTAKLANGIWEFMDNFGYVREGQAIWLCRNAHYYGIPRPFELRNVTIPKGPQPKKAKRQYKPFRFLQRNPELQ